MIKKNYSYILLFVIVAVLSSCSTKHIKYIQDKTAFFDEETDTVYKNVPQEYLLKEGDFLSINFITTNKELKSIFDFGGNSKDNSNSKTSNYPSLYQVNHEGILSLPILGDFRVGGLMIDSIQLNFQTRVDSMFSNTVVIVRLVGNRVAFLGEVGSEGFVYFKGDRINIIDAVALSGGISDYGDKRRIMVLRKEKGGQTVHRLDITDRSILTSPKYYLYPDDVVFIEPVKSKMLQLSLSQYMFLLSTLVSSITMLTLIFQRNG